MKKEIIIPLVIIGILVLSLVIGNLMPDIGMCTMMGCPCEGVEGERPCNTCTNSKHILSFGIVGLVKTCNSKEIMVCENGVQVDTRYDIDEASCKYKWVTGMR